MHFTVDQVVRALYQATFDREPEPEGLAAYSRVLEENPYALMDVSRSLFASDEHKSLLRRLSGEDHSQFGEYPIIVRRLAQLGSKHRIIVDVGARGKERSNSFDLLHHHGWRGLLVEANPSLYQGITDEFSGLDFELVRCAVGPTEGTMPFYIGTNNDVSSLNRQQAADWGEIRGEIQVSVRRLEMILGENAIPRDFDILSLDIEGLDISVFNDLILNSSYRPKTVVIEASCDFAVKDPSEVGVDAKAMELYEIVGQTRANFILGLRQEM